MPGRKKCNLVAVKDKWFIKLHGRRVDLPDAPFHERHGRRRCKDAAVRANVIGVRVGDAARFAVLAGIQREHGVAEANGFIVREHD